MFAYAAIGKMYDIPVVMTTSFEQGPNGPLPRGFLETYPDAPLIRRPGEVDAWDNADFREAVRATNKSQVIIAGITTDVCKSYSTFVVQERRQSRLNMFAGVTQLALSMRAEGYHVAVNIEASGTTNQRVAEVAFMRMQAAGVQLMNTFTI